MRASLLLSLSLCLMVKLHLHTRAGLQSLHYLWLPVSCALRLTHLEAFTQPQLQFPFTARATTPLAQKKVQIIPYFSNIHF